VSYSFAKIPSLLQQFEFLALIFICAFVIISALYINELLEIDDTFKKVHSIPLDATMRHIEKKIMFDNTSIVDKSCNTEITRTLHNHMNEDYNNFLTEIASDKSLPDPLEINYNKNGENLSFIDYAQELKNEIILLKGNTDITNPDSHKMSFKLPIQVESNEICDFTLSYRTNAYENAIDGKKDFFSLAVNRFTEKLVIKIMLTENIAINMKISYPKEVEPDGTTKKYEIVDAASEKMWSTERKMRLSKDIPKINRTGTEMSWKITDPQIGYTYIIYFTLENRDKNLLYQLRETVVLLHSHIK
jgi:hypothetical protein